MPLEVGTPIRRKYRAEDNGREGRSRLYLMMITSPQYFDDFNHTAPVHAEECLGHFPMDKLSRP